MEEHDSSKKARQVYPASKPNWKKSHSPSAYKKDNAFEPAYQKIVTSNSYATASSPLNCSKNLSGSLPDSGIGAIRNEILNVTNINHSLDNENGKYLYPTRELNSKHDYKQDYNEKYSTLNTSSTYCDEFNVGFPDSTIMYTSNLQRLCHSAAKHKMSIKPTNRKAPSRPSRGVTSKVRERSFIIILFYYKLLLEYILETLK